MFEIRRWPHWNQAKSSSYLIRTQMDNDIRSDQYLDDRFLFIHCHFKPYSNSYCYERWSVYFPRRIIAQIVEKMSLVSHVQFMKSMVMDSCWIARLTRKCVEKEINWIVGNGKFIDPDYWTYCEWPHYITSEQNFLT